MIKLILTGLALSFVSNFVFAVDNTLPGNCDYSKQESNDITTEELVTAIASGLELYGSPYDPAAWISFAESLGDLYDSFDYIRLEVPEYVIIGDDFTAKANLFDIYAYVDFHNSEKGYVGRDKSNLEANTYFNGMRFDATHGLGLIWAERDGLCHAKSVWVQHEPEALFVSAPVGGHNSVTLNVGWAFDEFSRVGIEANSDARVHMYAIGTNGVRSGTSREVSELSGTERLSTLTSITGTHAVYAYVFDGTYQSESIYVGRVNVTGDDLEAPCPGCLPY